MRFLSIAFALIAFIATVSCVVSDRTVKKETTAEETASLSSLDEMRSRRPSTFSGDAIDASHKGSELYKEHCASCHEGQVYKAPNAYWLGIMSAKNLYNTMASGIMQQQASALSEQERRQIVEHLVQQPFEEAFVEPKYSACRGDAAKFTAFNEGERTGWGVDTRRFVPKDVANLDKDDISRLKLKWSFGFPGAMRARSQPTVAMGAIFVGSQDGTVYALDLESGCVRWAYEASAEVRTGVVVANHSILGELAFFGDLIANVYAVKATTGELVWKVSADNHHSATLTGTPAFFNDRLYVPVSSLEVIPAADPKYECCTFRGHVRALNASDGATAWDSYSVDVESVIVGATSLGTRILAPSGAPVWTSPTIFASANMLIFGSGENYSSPADDNSDSIIAVRLDTGERIWQRQNVEGDAWNVACMMENNPNCPSDAWKHNLFISRYGDKFDLNDLGFMKRNGIKEVNGSSRYKRLNYSSDSILLSSSSKLDFGYFENTAGLRLESWLGIENEWDFRSTRSIELNFGVFSGGWDDRITRGNGDAAYSYGYWSYAEYRSPRGNEVNYFAAVEAEYNPEQEFSWKLSFGPEVYATDSLTFNGLFSVGRKEHWLIWDSEVKQLAGYDAAFFDMNLGLDWYPSDRHEVRIKFQWVGIDAEVVDGYELDDNGRLVVSDLPSSDFSLSDTALQVRYRFQIAPLSDIFLVYSRGGVL